MKHKVVYLLVVITLIGAFLRALVLNSGIDLDEAVTVFIANSSSPAELIDRIKLYDFGPPLYYAIMSLWMRIFGDSGLALTIPSVVFGILLIPCVYLLARELFEREDIALTSAFFAAISPLAALFSREVRSASLLAVLASLSFYFFIRCLKATRRNRLIGLGVCTTLMLYTHYAGLMLVGLMLVDALFYIKFPFRSRLFKPKQTIGTICGAVVLFLPWLPVLLEHQSAGAFPFERESMNSLPFVVVGNLAATLPLPWNASFVLLSSALVIAALIIAWKAVVLTFKRELIHVIDKHKGYTFLLANLLIPIMAYAYLTPLVGSQRYIMSFVYFGWIFWAGVAVELVSEISVRLHSRPTWRKKLVIGLLCAILAGVTFTEVKSFSDGDRSGMRRFAKDWNAKTFKHSALMIAPDFDSYTFIYYLNREQNAKVPPLYYTFPNQVTESPAKLKGYTDAFLDRQCVAKALDWVRKIDVAQAQKLVLVTDETEPPRKLTQAKERTKELVETLESHYPQVADLTHYHANGHSFAVRTFRLAEPPD